MASIRKRSEGQWEVRVRRRGYALACQTFATRRDAEAWAAVTESEMVRGVHVDRSEAERTSLKEVLVRYELEILPRKKENTRYKEGYIARMWQRQDLALPGPVDGARLPLIDLSEIPRPALPALLCRGPG